MMTLDAVRTALASPSPAAELDRLVRGEQAAGRRVKDIHTELAALVEPVRDAGTVSDDADDAIMDVLDALSGNCAPRWRYTDRPAVSLADRIRDAWAGGGPPALHRAAEELAAGGHPAAAIYDALEALLLEVRAAGADDATEDRITDVMERLTGWCHTSNHIRTAPPHSSGANGAVSTAAVPAPARPG